MIVKLGMVPDHEDESVKGLALIQDGPHIDGLHMQQLVGEHFSYIVSVLICSYENFIFDNKEKMKTWIVLMEIYH